MRSISTNCRPAEPDRHRRGRGGAGTLLRVMRGAAPRVALVVAVAALALLPAGAQATMFGSWSPNDPYDGDIAGIEQLERDTHRRVDIVNWFQQWGGGWTTVQPAFFSAVGPDRRPMLTWEPWDPNAGASQPGYTLQTIIDGAHDAYIATFARDLRDLRVSAAAGGAGAFARARTTQITPTVYLRMMHEMNGSWYPWSGVTNANTPAQFIQAWRHIVDVFRANRATNVKFVWSPYAVDVPATNLMENYYPGAGYVDVLATDGYNWGVTRPENGGWQTFSQVFAGAYDRLRALGSQPIWIAEVGAAPEAPADTDKAAWVRDMWARAATMDRLEAIVWFNENKERDWRANPDATVAAAFDPGTER